MIVRSAPLLAAFALLASPAIAQETPEAQPSLPEAVPEPATAPTLDGATPAPAIQRAIPASPFSLDQRTTWLAQCRNTYLRAGASLAGAFGQPDLCETQLQDFERTYVPAPDGSPPVLWVRVPVTRALAAPAPAPLDEAGE